MGFPQQLRRSFQLPLQFGKLGYLCFQLLDKFFCIGQAFVGIFNVGFRAGSFQSHFSAAEVQLDKIDPQRFQLFGKLFYGIHNGVCQKLYRFFQRPQQLVVLPDQPVDFGSFCRLALAADGSCGNALIDRRLLGDTARGKAAVVDSCIKLFFLQRPVDDIRPKLAPFDELFFAVPALGYGVLPAVFCAFRIFVHALIVCCLRRRQIFFSPST